MAEANGKSLDDILKSHHIVVCAGSGGVGKTTLAASLGVRAAELGLRTLVLTVDPAKRLATALGLDLRSDEIREVENLPASAPLSAAVVDSKKTFDGFIAKHASSKEAADKILNNSLYQQLSTTLSGSQEFTSLERLFEAYESEKYDLIILDTPPTKHAVDFLNAPQKLSNLFEDSIAKWFLSAGAPAKPGFFGALVSRGTRTVFKSLEVLTGPQFIEELTEFFASVRSVQAVLRDRTAGINRLMKSSETTFITVTSFDEAKLLEAKFLQGKLKELGYSLSAVIINRAFPLWLHEGEAQGSADLQVFYETFRAYYEKRYALYESFARQLPANIRLVRLPEYNQDIHGLDDLRVLATRLGQAAQ